MTAQGSVSELPARSTTPPFSLVQPLWQFMLLSLLTFNFYNLYWFYRNWKQLKNYKNLDIHPIGRTVGLIVPIYNLILVYRQFRYIGELAQEIGAPIYHSAGWVLVVYLLANALWRLPDPFGWLGLLSVLPLMAVQATLNALWRQVQTGVVPKTRFTLGEIIIGAMGSILWLGLLVGTLISILPALLPAVPVFSEISSSQLKVLNQRKTGYGEAVALSQNGRLMFTQVRDEVMVFDEETLTLRQPISFTSRIDARSVVWSPDNKRVVFHEWTASGIDTDLWVLEVDTGKLVNLTNDSVRSLLPSPSAQNINPLLDIYPAWSPDATELVFARMSQVANGTREVALYRIKASGGTPQKLITLSTATLVVYSTYWSRDGKSIYYTYRGGASDSNNGIWKVGLEGQNLKQVLRANVSQGQIFPTLLDVSADSRKALVVYESPYAPSFPQNLSRIVIMDLETGTIVPLKEAKDVKGAIEFYSPTAAGFSPDGKRVLFTYQDAKRAGRLVVRDIENRDEYLLLDQTSETNLLWYSLPNQRIYWGENNRVLVGNGQRTGLVLTLGAK